MELRPVERITQILSFCMADHRNLSEPFGVYTRELLDNTWRSQIDERNAASEQTAG